MSPSDRPLERRRAPRRVPAADEPLSQIRLRAGRELTVINISDAGLLTEGEMRLLPGTHVDVHLMTSDGRLLVRSRVVRAFVCRVSPSRICYRGALAFEHPVSTAVPAAIVGYAIPGVLGGTSGEPGKPYPVSATASLL